MIAAFNFFVAVKAETNSDIKVARRRLQHLLKALLTPAAATSIHIATVVVEPYGPNIARRERVGALMQRELAPIFNARPEVNVQFHVLPLLRPSLMMSMVDLALCKAELLCSQAAALQCQVMLIGGQTHVVRDSPPASFLIGKSTRHWILKRSAVPIYLEAENRLVLPGPPASAAKAKTTQAKAPKAPRRHLPFQPRMSMTSTVPAAA